MGRVLVHAAKFGNRAVDEANKIVRDAPSRA
jgi:hypothetical protein